MKKLVKNNVSWVGKVDWELLKFHGDDYSAKARLWPISSKEKTVLRCPMPFADEFVANLQKEIDLNKIAISLSITARSTTADLPALMKLIPDKLSTALQTQSSL